MDEMFKMNLTTAELVFFFLHTDVFLYRVLDK